MCNASTAAFLCKMAKFVPVVAKIIDIPRSLFWIKKLPQKMATMLAKITQTSGLEYRELPRIFFWFKWGLRGQKNVNSFGHGRRKNQDMLRQDTTCYDVLGRTTTCYSMLPRTIRCCSILLNTSPFYFILLQTPPCFLLLPHTTSYYFMLPRITSALF